MYIYVIYILKFFQTLSISIFKIHTTYGILEGLENVNK